MAVPLSVEADRVSVGQRRQSPPPIQVQDLEELWAHG